MENYLKKDFTYLPLRVEYDEKFRIKFDRAFPVRVLVHEQPNNLPTPYYFKSRKLADSFAYALRIMDGKVKYEIVDFSGNKPVATVTKSYKWSQ